ncbi:reverse transcriptase-like protein [Elysia marginata]|uniref:Reverse transcriptase-like protein n=1 Tax=Elysia marginata TaxID=1093978 RepID=A0AAV4HGH0_9GAST|nr:reverse transcriptase-like protein [Elysia marginata]
MKKLKALLNEHNILQLVYKPTHKDKHTLDLTLMRSVFLAIPKLDISDPHVLSDHTIITFKLNVENPKATPYTVNTRKLKKKELDIKTLKAGFDTHDHDILLSRLSSTYDICGSTIKWFHSYITNRHQKVPVVTVQDECEKLRLKFGVPQGSALRPILFYLYSAALHDVLVKHGFQFHINADDTQLFKSVDACKVPSLFESLLKCVYDVSEWMDANRLKSIHDKTEVFVIGTPAKVSTLETRS